MSVSGVLISALQSFLIGLCANDADEDDVEALKAQRSGECKKGLPIRTRLSYKSLITNRPHINYLKVFNESI